MGLSSVVFNRIKPQNKIAAEYFLSLGGRNCLRGNFVSNFHFCMLIFFFSVATLVVWQAYTRPSSL